MFLLRLNGSNGARRFAVTNDSAGGLTFEVGETQTLILDVLVELVFQSLSPEETSQYWKVLETTEPPERSSGQHLLCSFLSVCQKLTKKILRPLVSSTKDQGLFSLK